MSILDNCKFNGTAPKAYVYSINNITKDSRSDTVLRSFLSFFDKLEYVIHKPWDVNEKENHRPEKLKTILRGIVQKKYSPEIDFVIVLIISHGGSDETKQVVNT